MLAIHTILHPTDFSPRSESAFQVACALARDYGARLLVLHVMAPPVVVLNEMGPVPSHAEGEEESLEEKLHQMHPPDARVHVDYLMETGDPAAEILRVAEENACELIVLGTHGRRGLGRLLMGSVAEKVLRKATCPVLTVKTPLPATLTETAAAEAEAVPAS